VPVRHHVAALATEPFDAAARCRQRDHRDVGELGDGELDNRPGRAPRVQRQPEPAAGRGEEPGPGALGEQAVEPGALLGDVGDVPRGPPAGQRSAPGGEGAPAQLELDLPVRGRRRRGQRAHSGHGEQLPDPHAG
jgi:hypothetical protein